LLSACLPGLPAADTSVVEFPFLGVTHISRTGSAPDFPRDVKMHIVKIDLTAPFLSFELTPPGGTRDVIRLTTLDFLTQEGAQIAINAHFFLPFPSTDLNAELVGFAASNGTVFSPFELPSQSYAIVRDAPAINIDANNNASVVNCAAGFADGTCSLCVTNDGLHVQQPVTLWNAFAGSAQIITDGVKTIPCYVDATHPDCQLASPVPAYYSNSFSWYSLISARVAIGLSRDNQTLFLFTVDDTNDSSGMTVPEVADLLLNDYGVYNALNMDGGGSTTLAMENPVTHVRALVNTSSDSDAGRLVATSLAVFASSLTSVPHTVNTSPAGLSFSIDGAAYTSAASPVWTYGSSHAIATTSPQTAVGTRYSFNNWSDSGSISHTVSGAASPQTYTASFDVSYQLSTAVSPARAGTVTPASGRYFPPNTTVRLQATAKAGYVFSGWTGSAANPAASSTSITMTGPLSVTANFTALPVRSPASPARQVRPAPASVP
jgi:uncharacterized repeat protein (TIGR02543 family)